jgi:hypothetical protein
LPDAFVVLVGEGLLDGGDVAVCVLLDLLEESRDLVLEAYDLVVDAVDAVQQVDCLLRVCPRQSLVALQHLQLPHQLRVLHHVVVLVVVVVYLFAGGVEANVLNANFPF